MLVERECVFCTFSFLYEINLGELRFFEWFIRNTQDGKTCQETIGNMMIIDEKHALLKLEAVVRDKDGALSEMEDGQEIPIVNTVIIEDEALCWHVCKEETGNWISVCLMDDEGNFINNGVAGMGEAAKPDSNGAFVVIGIYEKMDLPDHINLRVKDLNSGEVDYLENIPRLEE